MTFKMKGSAFKLNNVATTSALKAGDKKSPLEQRTKKDVEADRRRMRMEHGELKGLALIKALREEKKEQKRIRKHWDQEGRAEEMEGKYVDRLGDFETDYSTATSGQQPGERRMVGHVKKQPKWWSSGKKKREYLDEMRGRDIMGTYEKRGEAMSKEDYDNFISAGIDPTTLKPIEKGRGIY